MDILSITTWAVLAAVIGGVLAIVKRIVRSEARWWKDVALPVLPLLSGACIAWIPGILEGPLAWRILQGIAAGLAAGWVYDRWRDKIRGGK